MTTRLKQLLVALGGGTIVLAFVLLGLWQMEVFRSQGENSAEAIAAQPVLQLEDSLTNGRVGGNFGRTVEVSGNYLDEPQRLAGEQWPLRVVTPLKTDKGLVVAVVRGTVEQGQQVPAAPTGRQSVRGVVLPTEGPGALVGPGAPKGAMTGVRLDVLAQDWPAPLLDGYVTMSADASKAQGLGEAPLMIPDQRGNVRNEGYALQWWAFGAFGAVMTWIAVRRIGAGQRALPELGDTSRK